MKNATLNFKQWMPIYKWKGIFFHLKRPHWETDNVVVLFLKNIGVTTINDSYVLILSINFASTQIFHLEKITWTWKEIAFILKKIIVPRSNQKSK